MLNYIKRAQKYPESKRKRIAFIGAVVGTSLVVGVWLLGEHGSAVLKSEQTARADDALKTNPAELSPLATWRSALGGVLEDVGERVVELTSFIGVLEYER